MTSVNFFWGLYRPHPLITATLPQPTSASVCFQAGFQANSTRSTDVVNARHIHPKTDASDATDSKTE